MTAMEVTAHRVAKVVAVPCTAAHGWLVILLLDRDGEVTGEITVHDVRTVHMLPPSATTACGRYAEARAAGEEAAHVAP